MVLNEQNLKKALEQPLRHGVYYYYSTEEYLVRSYAAKTLALLAKQEDDAEVTRVEGPAPSIEEAVAAWGTTSFFGLFQTLHFSVKTEAWTCRCWSRPR